jgi:hypothetical protein
MAASDRRGAWAGEVLETRPEALKGSSVASPQTASAAAQREEAWLHLRLAATFEADEAREASANLEIALALLVAARAPTRTAST